MKLRLRRKPKIAEPATGYGGGGEYAADTEHQGEARTVTVTVGSATVDRDPATGRWAKRDGRM